MSRLSVVLTVFAFSVVCLASPGVVPAGQARGPVSYPVAGSIVIPVGRVRGAAVRLVGQANVPVAVSPNSVSFKPYEFGYELGDGLGMTQHRREFADDTGVVRGSYGYRDPIGVSRVVEYVADNNGYRAVVRSNEPGTASQNTGDAVFIVQPPPAAALVQGLGASRGPRQIV